jgi:hypothetical protein
MLAPLALIACGGPVSPQDRALAAGAPSPLEPADAVAVADLDGDGRDEVVRVRQGRASWWDKSQDLGGVVQAVARGDVDGDGQEEALIATGMGRGALEASARLWAVGAEGAKLLWERRTERSQVTDLQVIPGDPEQPDRVFLVAFRDERIAQGGWLVDGALQVAHEQALALRMLPVRDGLLVGRLYGDEPKSHGDLRLVGDAPRLVPTLRGVRALAAADLDGDGTEDWLVADGWHFAYGQQADATVRLVPGDGRPARIIARLDQSYAVNQLEVGRPAPGAAPVILASASHEVVLLQQDGLGYAPTPIAPLRETGNARLHYDGPALSVVISGEPATRVPLAPGAAKLSP